MATSYSTVYNAALFYFRDTDLFCLIEAEAEAVLHGYMMQAVANFAPYCKHDLLDRDEEYGEFKADLTDIEVDILALGMAVGWTEHRVRYQDNLRDRMSSKDYTYHSRGNLLASMHDIMNTLNRKFRNRMMDYTYNNGDISSLHI
jgi:hypothetical protein|nr:MAG TPA: hypothetical protein [Caudoviricetes sp.]